MAGNEPGSGAQYANSKKQRREENNLNENPAPFSSCQKRPPPLWEQCTKATVHAKLEGPGGSTGRAERAAEGEGEGGGGDKAKKLQSTATLAGRRRRVCWGGGGGR